MNIMEEHWRAYRTHTHMMLLFFCRVLAPSYSILCVELWLSAYKIGLKYPKMSVRARFTTTEKRRLREFSCQWEARIETTTARAYRKCGGIRSHEMLLSSAAKTDNRHKSMRCVFTSEGYLLDFWRLTRWAERWHVLFFRVIHAINTNRPMGFLISPPDEVYLMSFVNFMTWRLVRCSVFVAHSQLTHQYQADWTIICLLPHDWWTLSVGDFDIFHMLRHELWKWMMH